MTIAEEILQLSYIEHFKALKDLSLVFPPEHPQRIKLQDAIDNILKLQKK